MISKEKIKKYSSYKLRAKNKQISFKLSEMMFYAILHTQCYICGKNGNTNELGMDRLNNTKGYEKGNVAACCWECNKLKGKLTTKDFFTWLKRIQPKHSLLKGHAQTKGYFLNQLVVIDIKLTDLE